METPELLIKVVSIQTWEKSQAGGILICEALDDDFIHMATDAQAPRVIKKFWDGKEHILLHLDPSKLIGTLKYESNPGRESKYYHLYDGHIPISAVQKVVYP